MQIPSRWLCLAASLAGMAVRAETIVWYSDPGKTNRDSDEAPMDGAYRFELGVFDGSFVPTLANKTDWAANWNAAMRTGYNAANKRFAGTFTVTPLTVTINPEFVSGKPAYVWGFRGDALGGEWILLRMSSWPVPNPMNPFGLDWNAGNATAVIGRIDPDGIPFLMESAAVANAAPPASTWTQWKAEFLAGELLNGENDDPDHDGSSNLLEFVFGTPPTSAGAPAATPVELSGGHLQITIPRRIDHLAALTVEVSDDLTNWHSGPAHTAVVADGITALVVRDLTARDASHPKRFMRLGASIP